MATRTVMQYDNNPIARVVVESGLDFVVTNEVKIKQMICNIGRGKFTEALWDEVIDRVPRLYELWDADIAPLEVYFFNNLRLYLHKRVAKELRYYGRYITHTFEESNDDESTKPVDKQVAEFKTAKYIEDIAEVHLLIVRLSKHMSEDEIDMYLDRYLHGMTQLELANMHGVTVHAMRKMLDDVCKKVKRALDLTSCERVQDVNDSDS